MVNVPLGTHFNHLKLEMKCFSFPLRAECLDSIGRALSDSLSFRRWVRAGPAVPFWPLASRVPPQRLPADTLARLVLAEVDRACVCRRLVIRSVGVGAKFFASPLRNNDSAVPRADFGHLLSVLFLVYFFLGARANYCYAVFG